MNEFFDMESYLAESVERIRSGSASLEECLAAHPEWKDELEPALFAALAMARAPKESADENFKADVRSTLVEKAGAMGAAGAFDAAPADGTRIIPAVAPPREATVEIPLPGVKAAEKLTRPSPPSWWERFSRSPKLAIAGAAAVLLLLAGTAAYASSFSQPGSILYPVKRVQEQIQLTAALGAQSKAQVHLGIAERRLSEIGTLVADSPKNLNDAQLADLAFSATDSDFAAKQLAAASGADRDRAEAAVRDSFARQRVIFEKVAESIPPRPRAKLAAVLGAEDLLPRGDDDNRGPGNQDDRDRDGGGNSGPGGGDAREDDRGGDDDRDENKDDGDEDNSGSGNDDDRDAGDDDPDEDTGGEGGGDPGDDDGDAPPPTSPPTTEDGGDADDGDGEVDDESGGDGINGSSGGGRSGN